MHANGYQILRKVADSNTAVIVQAVRLVGKGRGDEFALKILRPEFADDKTERAFLENEFRVCQGMEHPNLVRIWDVQTDVAEPFLVMEYVPGRSLRDILMRRTVELGVFLKLMAQIADGLAYFHEGGFVHRDVKPQNMVIGKDGLARAIDFALAIRADTSFGQHLLRKWREGRRPGTWSYMSPEQIRNQRLTGQADVYGLGVTLYEAIAGRLPYIGETQQDILVKHLRAPIPTVRAARPDLPIELSDFVQGMMAKDPLDRPTGMGYVSGKLRDLAGQVRGTTQGRGQDED